jgi:hypothetical protein
VFPWLIQRPTWATRHFLHSKKWNKENAGCADDLTFLDEKFEYLFAVNLHSLNQYFADEHQLVQIRSESYIRALKKLAAISTRINWRAASANLNFHCAEACKRGEHDVTGCEYRGLKIGAAQAGNKLLLMIVPSQI